MKLTYPQEVGVVDQLEEDALERAALVCGVGVRDGVLELDALEEDVLVHDELEHGGALENGGAQERGGAQEHGEL